MNQWREILSQIHFGTNKLAKYASEQYIYILYVDEKKKKKRKIYEYLIYPIRCQWHHCPAPSTFCPFPWNAGEWKGRRKDSYVACFCSKVSRAFLRIWRLSDSPTGSSLFRILDSTRWVLHQSQNEKTASQIQEILSRKCTSGDWNHAPNYLLSWIPQPRPLCLNPLPYKRKKSCCLSHRWMFSSCVILEY